MDIIVCIKQAARYNIPNAVDSSGQLKTEDRVLILNPYDEIAVEEALRIREKIGSGSVTLVTVGPARAQAVLRRGLAMGADAGLHLLSENGHFFDAWGIAAILSAAISKMPHDLLLFGRLAIDDMRGQVGVFTAGLLKLPVVTAAARIDIDHEKRTVRIERSLDRGNRELLACPLPAAFTVDKVANRPRYPTWPARKQAQTAVIKAVSVEALGFSGEPGEKINKTFISRYAPPKLRPKKILAPDSSMSAANRLKFIMSGGMAKKSGEKLGGSPAQLADGIIAFLSERKMIPPDHFLAGRTQK